MSRGEHFAIVIRKVQNGTYGFSRLKTLKLSNGRRVFVPTIRDRIILDILKDRIRGKYRVKYGNRPDIIDEIIGKLRINMPYFIVRLDIKDYFESIPHHLLLHKLRRSALLDYEEYLLVKQIIRRDRTCGIPQGLSISNVLSEIFLESLDDSLRLSHPRINSYFRYVDDIFILINGNFLPSETEQFKQCINSIFASHRLSINNDKAQYLTFQSNRDDVTPVEYLGYKFSSSGGRLHVSIADSKVAKLKDRIDAIFKAFDNTGNYAVLFEQLKYITYKKSAFRTNVKIIRGRPVRLKRKIYFGVTESYKRVAVEDSVWANLDRYLRGKIRYRKALGKLSTRHRLRSLFSISFAACRQHDYIYKLHLLSRTDLIDKLLRLDPALVRSHLATESRNQLFSRYFAIVNIS
ncbi:antiviral reverse transcriptase Drt3a [Alicyclobacillus sp. ALC3]|uniref:antiviral reverse transcriptase Drt3a n=1 Tax=Alicyclobacillus sp. ALC3 TaxID=2796143 RepID=UPI003FCDE016